MRPAKVFRWGPRSLRSRSNARTGDQSSPATEVSRAKPRLFHTRHHGRPPRDLQPAAPSATKSNRSYKVKTPGGRLTIHRLKKSTGPKCGDFKCRLPALRTEELRVQELQEREARLARLRPAAHGSARARGVLPPSPSRSGRARARAPSPRSRARAPADERSRPRTPLRSRRARGLPLSLALSADARRSRRPRGPAPRPRLVPSAVGGQRVVRAFDRGQKIVKKMLLEKLKKDKKEGDKEKA